MEFDMDPRQRQYETVASPESPPTWFVDRSVGDDGAVRKARWPQYSFQSACECPDACPRDHENE